MPSFQHQHSVYVDMTFKDLFANVQSDMRKGTDTQTLSEDVLMDCGNIKPDTLNFTSICNQKWIIMASLSI